MDYKTTATIGIIIMFLGCMGTAGPDLSDSEKSALIYSFISKIGIIDASVNVSSEEIRVEYELPPDIEEKASWFAIAGSAAAVSPESETIVLREYVDNAFKKEVCIKMADVLKVINGEISLDDLELDITNTSKNIIGKVGILVGESVKTKINATPSLEGVKAPVVSSKVVVDGKTVKNASPVLEGGKVAAVSSKVVVSTKSLEKMSATSVKPVLSKINASEPDSAQIAGIKDLMEGVKDLEDELNSLGDDAQLSNLELQNAMQKQQQMMQTLSNVMKSMHESAMSIIRNIK